MGKMPTGQRFSHVYLERGKPTKDSPRMRRRLAAYLSELNIDVRIKSVESIHRELGVDVPAQVGYNLRGFFDSAELKDVLDAITIIWRVFPYRRTQEIYQSFVQRVFEEENVGYRIDELGGVHYFVDEEFERNRVSVLSCLGESRYVAVAAEFESGIRRLDEDPPNTKDAVRSVFVALEILVKLMVDGEKVARLGPAEVERYLKPLAGQAYNENRVASDSANQVLNALSDWINANQMYRHGQKVEEPAPPPLELAVVIVSTGASFLRWLVELDSRRAR